MRENKTAYAILGMLSHEDMTGYDIKKRIEASLAFFWNAGFGQIYPALASLEGQRLVTKRTDVEEKRPKRIIYSITDGGRRELEQWLAEPVEKEDVRYEILLKLFFAGGLPAERSIAVIEAFRARNAGQLAQLMGFKRELAAILDESDDHLHYYLTVLFGEKVLGAYLEWAEEAKTLLAQPKKSPLPPAGSIPP